MPPNNRVGRRALAATVLLLFGAPVAAAEPAATDLDALRQQGIAAAHRLQQQEGTIIALEHQIELLGQDAAGRQRGLDESRAQQADLLGTLERIERNPREPAAFAFADPLDRLRSGMLVAAVAPALRAEAHALGAETERIAVLHRQIAARQRDLAGAQDAREKERQGLEPLVAARLDLARKLLPDDPGAEARLARLGREASDFGDLIKRAEAAIERRDKEILARARGALPKAEAATLAAEAADPTRPQLLHAFDPPQSALLLPVSGTISRRFGTGDAGQAAQGLTITTLAAGEVVAPSDGRVIYAGPFRNFGLVLIIGHGALYHSVLTELGRIDVRLDQWLLAGEPVGSMPDAPAPELSAPGRVGVTNSVLYYELRHDGRPVDPQPWLAIREDRRSREVPGGPEAQTGDQRVHE